MAGSGGRLSLSQPAGPPLSLSLGTKESPRARSKPTIQTETEIKAARVFRLIDRSVDDVRPNCLSVQPVRRLFLGEMDFSVCVFEPRETERMMEDVQRACTRTIGMVPWRSDAEIEGN